LNDWSHNVKYRIIHFSGPSGSQFHEKALTSRATRFRG